MNNYNHIFFATTKNASLLKMAWFSISTFVKLRILKISLKNRICWAMGAIFLLCLLPTSMFAQNLRKADKMFTRGSYNNALKHYQEALDNSSQDSVALSYRIGECLLEMNQPEEAINWLTIAQKNGYNESDLLYSLGVNYMLLGQYDLALRNFQAYAVKEPNDKRTVAKIASCSFAKRDTSINLAIDLRPIEILNTKGSEYGVSYYKNQLIYSSTGFDPNMKTRKISPRTGLGYASLYIAQPKDDLFSAGTKLENILGEKANRGVFSYDVQSEKLYCTNCRSGQEDCYISIIEIRGTRFKETGRLELGKVEYGIGHPFVTNDGKRLYFTSTMEGGYGGDDIWYTEKQSNGKWGKPVNLGSGVNTPGSEVFPYIHNDYLFFSSDGHEEGYGGLDLYVSKITGDTFGKAFNLRHPFNSKYDDFNLIINSDQTGGIMVSNRNNKESSDDIYQFKGYPCVATLEGFVYDKETKEPLKGADIVLHDSKGQPLGKYVTDSQAHYSAFLQPGVSFRVNASSNGYNDANKQFNGDSIVCFTKANKANGYDSDFYLEKNTMLRTSIGDTIVVKDIYYEYDLSRITRKSQEELDKIVALLKKYLQINILVTSHTDGRGGEAYNQRLSESRANSVAAYLKRQGIATKRIETKGYGKSQLIFAHANNEEQQQLNRRTTFTLLSAGTLTDEQVKMLTTEDLLKKETPRQIVGYDKWWVELAVVEHANLSFIDKIEKKAGMSVEAIKTDDGLTRLCVGSFESSQQASEIATLLKNRGVKAVVKSNLQPVIK